MVTWLQCKVWSISKWGHFIGAVVHCEGFFPPGVIVQIVHSKCISYFTTLAAVVVIIIITIAIIEIIIEDVILSHHDIFQECI